MNINPFAVTKAVDFSDAEIERTYIPFSSAGNPGIVDPQSPMPHFLVGAKGGGRTHLMRHLATPIRRRPTLEEVRNAGYIGIYFRCSGLNGSRFRGASADDSAWARIFAYYMDLWLAEQLVASARGILKGNVLGAVEEGFRQTLTVILGADAWDANYSSEEALAALRREVDVAVNNAPLIGLRGLTIRSAPGALVFSLARIIVDRVHALRSCRITFLVDEYENLSTAQQEYFNTLIREKEPPVTFIVGGRQWGIRTHATLSGGEENKQGSEYELTVLEDKYRGDEPAYSSFAKAMLDLRVRATGIDTNDVGVLEVLYGPSPTASDRRLPSTGKHLERLRRALEKAHVPADAVAETAMMLDLPQREFISRLSLLRFYLQWSESKNVDVVSIARAARDWVAPLVAGKPSRELLNFRSQRRLDIEAQMYADAGKQLPYLGPDALIQMSGFLPRNLLMTLKYVMQWAEFYGERPFEDLAGVSEQAQAAGVLEASRWFLQDAKPFGRDGAECEQAILRLGRLLRDVRLSDKPSEVSVSSFSSNLQGAPEAAIAVLDRCVSHGLLVRVTSGRTGRNHGTQHKKYQLHPMIAPMFGASTGRRGDLTLTSDEFSRVFDPAVTEEVYSEMVRRRLRAMTAPFGIDFRSTDSALF